MKLSPRFTIVDDDHDLLNQFTAYMREIVGYARLEYLRTIKYRLVEEPLERVPMETLRYEDPLPISKDEFDFAEDKLSEAFSGLNGLRRKLLTLIFVEGLTAQETADRLGLTVGYVYLQKHRALKALRDQLMDEGGSMRG